MISSKNRPKQQQRPFLNAHTSAMPPPVPISRMLPEVKSLFAWATTEETLKRGKSKSSSKELGIWQLAAHDRCSLMPLGMKHNGTVTADAARGYFGPGCLWFGNSPIFSGCLCSCSSASFPGQLVCFTTTSGFYSRVASHLSRTIVVQKSLRASYPGEFI